MHSAPQNANKVRLQLRSELLRLGSVFTTSAELVDYKHAVPRVLPVRPLRARAGLHCAGGRGSGGQVEPQPCSVVHKCGGRPIPQPHTASAVSLSTH
eukprot:8969087-Pyramimonas_sp.AAC.1